MKHIMQIFFSPKTYFLYLHNQQIVDETVEFQCILKDLASNVSERVKLVTRINAQQTACIKDTALKILIKTVVIINELGKIFECKKPLTFKTILDTCELCSL